MNRTILYILLETFLLVAYILAYQLLDEHNDLNVMMYILIAILFKNVILNLNNFTQNAFFLSFNGVVFLFLISRPFIASIYNIDWAHMGVPYTWKSLFIIGLSLFGLHIGHLLFKSKLFSFKHNPNRKWEILPNKMIITTLFLVVGLVNFSTELMKYSLLKDLEYVDIYINSIQLPTLLVQISSLFIFTFIAFLATFPSKNQSYLALVFYAISISPSVLLGERANIAVLVVFSILYIVLRQKNNNDINTKWFNKKHIAITLCLLPLLAILFSAIQDMREKSNISDRNMNSISDFIYLQGTSFDTISQGIKFEQEIDQLSQSYLYSGGPILDKLMYSKVGQIVFGQNELDSGNSMKNAILSNNLAHPLSYIVLEGSYLKGHGRGSSFILENYLDFGYIGVFICSTLLGFFISLLWNYSYNNIIYSMICLASIMHTIMLPRINYTFNISFLFDLKFWMVILIIAFTGKFFKVDNRGVK